MKHYGVGMALLIAIGLLSACAAPGSSRSNASTTFQPVATKESGNPEAAALIKRIRDDAPAPAADDTRIHALDALSISVFQVPDLSRKVKVNSKGEISLPLVGVVPAAGITTVELEAEIARRLSATYLQNPQVSVVLEESAHERLTVEGAVRSPGVFPMQGRTSLLQAIAMAGGTDRAADERAIAVFRSTVDGRIVAMFDLKKIRTGNAPDPELKGEDIIIVDRNGSKAFLDGVLTGLRDLVTFGIFR